jgi:hypothetical protein
MKMDACFVDDGMFRSLVKSNKLLKEKRNQLSPPHLFPPGSPPVEIVPSLNFFNIFFIDFTKINSWIQHC